MKEEDYLNFKGSKEDFIKKNLTPAVCGGKVFRDYFVDKDGDIWGLKYNKLKTMKWYYNKKNGYPRVALCEDGISYKLLSHRIVCETFHEKPLPEGVSEEEWKRTPKSVKRHFDHYWEVNHIDHVKTNFHPSNLEWVSCKQNVEKYKKHYALKKAS